MKSDARVRYTQMILKKSILKLLVEKPINKISVKEICLLADLNRATFYSHYKDAFDLLEQIQKELYSELELAMRDTKRNNLNNVVEKVFSIINENIDLCKILFSKNGDQMFLRQIAEIWQEPSIQDWQNQFPRATKEQLTLTYTFIVNGALAVIEKWVNTGMHENPQELGIFIQGIGNKALAVFK